MIGLLALAVGSMAHAQDERPPVAADLYRPSYDGGPFLVTEVSHIPRGALGGLQVSWAREPLRIIVDGETSPVVSDAVAVHLGARVGIGPLQVGVAAPGYVIARVDGNRTVLGDPTLDLKLATTTDRYGGGVVARLGTSLGASDWQLGYPGPFAELGAVGDLALGPVAVAGNLGVRFTPEQPLADIVIDDAFWFRLGASVEVRERWDPGLEIWGQRSLAAGTAVTPVEALLQVRHRWPTGAAVHGGLGTGLTSGVGAPRWRLVVGASFTTKRDVTDE